MVTPLHDGLVIGRDEEVDIVLPDASVSRRHVVIARQGGAWTAEDLGSRSGTFLNGHPFQREILAVGDLLGVGPFSLRFDGRGLSRCEGLAGAEVHASNLTTTRSGLKLLDHVSLNIASGAFVGVLGPSGAGKSTLLDALCGLRPPDSGTVTIDGLEIERGGQALRESLGYVPQDDIVPLELTVQRALVYSALLRLSRGTPRAQAKILAEKTALRVGLGGRLHTRVARLSGGQRKRVSVAAELLGRPRLLFLDEPTSGLDPATELRLMETLRELTAQACTVVCTTHVVENAHLFDALAVMRSGCLVYYGPPSDAPAVFGVQTLGEIYAALESGAEPSTETPPPARTRVVLREMAPVSRRALALPILMERQAAMIASDPKNAGLLIGQPVLIALLVAWVSRDPGLLLFFAYVATLWFGCGNAAQEIVRELPIYRRERLIGLGRSPYLFSKFLVLAGVTSLQALLLYGVLQVVTGGVGGDARWQISVLVMTALASVAIGLGISAWAKSAMQAVMLVPLILIPQILFSGFVTPAGDMKAAPYAVSLAMPSAAAQSIMDVSLFWDKTIAGALRVDFPTTFTNLNRDRSLRNGEVFRNAQSAWRGFAVLGVWTALALTWSWFFLRRRERG